MPLDETAADRDDTRIVRGACPHDCPDTCALQVTVHRGRVIKVQGDPDHPPTHGALCTKVSRYAERTYHPQRVLHPLRRVQLVPGNVDTSLARLCNQLGQFDLVIVSSYNDERHLERAWFFIQRMLATDATVFFQPAAGAAWTALARSRLDALAAQPVLRRAG